MIATPAVACGTNTLHKLCLRPAQNERTASVRSTMRRRAGSISSSSESTIGDGDYACSHAPTSDSDDGGAQFQKAVIPAVEAIDGCNDMLGMVVGEAAR